jgi:hypothetical protein
MSRDARYLLDTWSDPTHPPEARLLDRKGAQLAVLQPNALDERHPYAPYRALHRAPTYGTVKSVDGQVLHYGYVTPPDFDPAKRYPVMLRYYGGPGRQFLTKAWTSGVNTGFTDLLTQYWAQQGYIVFALDNRGTPRRDVAFGHAIHRQLGKGRDRGPARRRGLAGAAAVRRRQAHRRVRLELRRLPDPDAAVPGLGPGRGRRRGGAGHRLRALRHALHRALPRAADHRTRTATRRPTC